MIKFVIIDNQEDWQVSIKAIITKLAFELKDMQIETYNAFTPELKKTIHDNSYHKVYILDVELSGSVSGLKIAEYIRSLDHFSHIIFLTNQEGMFELVHRNVFEVYSFIEKFHNAEKRLSKAIKIIVDIEFEKDIFKYSNKNIDIQIFYSEILYIIRDTTERKVIIHTKQDTFSINITLKEVKTLLDSRFRQVHRACIVNNDEVKLYDWGKKEFVLKSGERIPLLSRNFRI